MTRAELRERYKRFFEEHAEVAAVPSIPSTGDERVQTHKVRDVSDVTGEGGGILFYRCGGGRRIVKKRLGGS